MCTWLIGAGNCRRGTLFSPHALNKPESKENARNWGEELGAPTHLELCWCVDRDISARHVSTEGGPRTCLHEGMCT